MLLVLLSSGNVSVVRVSPTSHDYPRNRSVLYVGRDVAPHCLQPPTPYAGFLRKRACKHVPLQLVDLVTARPLELVATAALNHT